MLRFPRIFILLLLSSCAWAASDLYPFSTPAESARFGTLTESLRCLVCQNETLADSGATLAADLREQIYKKIRQGESDNEIIDYLVSRYGHFILYRPPLLKKTILLWFGPLVFLSLAIYWLIKIIRRSPEK